MTWGNVSPLLPRTQTPLFWGTKIAFRLSMMRCNLQVCCRVLQGVAVCVAVCYISLYMAGYRGILLHITPYYSFYSLVLHTPYYSWILHITHVNHSLSFRIPSMPAYLTLYVHTARPNQWFMFPYWIELVTWFQKSILLIMQYKYLKDHMFQDLILRTRFYAVVVL